MVAMTHRHRGDLPEVIEGKAIIYQCLPLPNSSNFLRVALGEPIWRSAKIQPTQTGVARVPQPRGELPCRRTCWNVCSDYCDIFAT
jgi:hypothetical protein